MADANDSLQWPAPDAGFHAYTIPVEEIEEDGCFVLRAEIPGIDIERDLDVQLRGHALEIRARRDPERTTLHRENRHSEFQYGWFWRVLTLPNGARESEVEARYRNGILEVRIPVAQTTSREGTRVAVRSA